MIKKIKTALISVYYKNGIEDLLKALSDSNVVIYSTGGTYDFIKSLNIDVKSVESLTGYPSILGGRVKTLHPKIFGGILNRRDNNEDVKQLVDFQIPEIDLVIVDLYPFQKTIENTENEIEIIEKIDIGGISLIRAAAKNFNDVVCIASSSLYKEFFDIISKNNCETNLEERKYFAAQAFNISSNYDSAIFNYFNKNAKIDSLKISENQYSNLRYGENPHQKGIFYGDIEKHFTKLNGKEISYNNLLDIEAAINLIDDFEETTIAIIKHNNACGIASNPNLNIAWQKALSADPISAFGGVIVSNKIIDNETAKCINELFFEIIIAPSFEPNALEILKSKKNRVIVKRNIYKKNNYQYRSLLNGTLVQETDNFIDSEDNFSYITNLKPTQNQIVDLIFAQKIVKHTKSNAIVIVKDQQMLSSGMGQTSRVDALKQAIDKAKSFKFDLNGSSMASDAFFPFPDSVEIASNEGINSIIQPGGSIRDNESIQFCNNNNIAMVFTGMRHFKH